MKHATHTPPRYRLPPYTVHRTARSLAETIDWGLRLAGVPDAWTRTKGEGIKVAVLDTGVDANHPDLVRSVVEAVDFTDSRNGPDDRNGHGTHVAGIIAARQNDVGVVGVAPEASVIAVKVLNNAGMGLDAWIAEGLEFAARRKVHIASMSLGSDQYSPAIHAGIRAVIEAGGLVICAAGNDGQRNSVDYPAKLKETIAVSAVNEQGELAAFSSYGPEIDVAAPGANVLSTWPGGQYARISGTSMATPFVSGVVALRLAAAREASEPIFGHVERLRAELARTARDKGPPGHDPEYGWGLIDAAKLLEEQQPPTDPGGDTEEPVTDGEVRTIRFGPVAIHFPARAGDWLSVGPA